MELPSFTKRLKEIAVIETAPVKVELNYTSTILIENFGFVPQWYIDDESLNIILMKVADDDNFNQILIVDKDQSITHTLYNYDKLKQLI